jgi:hypothetical protein
MRKPRKVTLHVREPSVVELTVGDTVQLDHLVPAQHGHVAQRHGDLLKPGVTTLLLEQGFYLFKTLSEANLRVVRGGVDATTGTGSKDPPPPPPPVAPGGELPPPLAQTRGDEAPGEMPVFTVEA